MKRMTSAKLLGLTQEEFVENLKDPKKRKFMQLMIEAIRSMK